MKLRLNGPPVQYLCTVGLEHGIADGRAAAEADKRKRAAAIAKAQRDEELSAAEIIAVGKRAAEYLAAHGATPQLEVTGGGSLFDRPKPRRKVWILPHVDGVEFAVTEAGDLYTLRGVHERSTIDADTLKAQDRLARRLGFTLFTRGLRTIEPSSCYVHPATGSVYLSTRYPGIEYMVGKAIGLLEAQS